jgi:hypothetical protein
MASIANLNVKLTASIGAFTASMAKAAAPLKAFADKVGGVGEKLSTLSAAGTALAGGGMAFMLHQSMEAIDVNAKLSDRLGISTEALVGLQHGAGLAGTSVEELTGGLEKMLKNLAEAATTGGPAKDALEQMGLSAAQLVNVAPDQAFEQIAQGLTDIQNPAQRAAAAMDIFGKSGQSLLPFLMSGKQGIRDMKAEAEKMGLTYSRLDASKVEQANDAITRMKEVFTGAAQSLAIKLAPVIEQVANWVRENKDLVSSSLKWTAIVGGALLVLPKLIGGFSAVTSAVSAAGTALKFAFANPLVTVGIAAVAAFTAVLVRSIAMNESWSESAYQMSRAIGLFGNATQNLAAASEDYGKTRSKILDLEAQAGGAKSLDERLDAQRDLVAELQRQLDTTKKIVDLQGEVGQDNTGWAKRLGIATDNGDLGFTPKMVDDVRAKLAAAEQSLARMRAAKASWVAAFEAPDNDAATRAKAIRTVTERLAEQAATAGMTASQIKLWEITSQGATDAQVAFAKSLIERADATQRAADLAKALTELEKGAAQAGMTDNEKKIEELRALGAGNWEVVRALEAMRKVADVETAKKGADAVAELRKEVEQFGATDSQKKFADLAALGVGPEQLEQAKKLLNQLDALNAAKLKADQMENDAKAVFESTRTPLEKYESTIGRLSDLLNAGAIDWDTYGRAVRQAREQLEGGDKVGAPAALLHAGSAEAQQFRFDQTRGVQKLTSKDEVPKKQLEEQKAGNRLLNDIERNTRPVKDDTQVLSL